MKKRNALPCLEELDKLFIYDPKGVLRYKGRTKRWEGVSVGVLNSTGYVYTRIKEGRFQVHRLIWKLCKRRDPAGDIDHVNGIRSDNRVENLREATGYQNAANQKRREGKALSKGVSFRRDTKKYRAILCHKGTYHRLGNFTTEAAAAAAYLRAAKKLNGEFARAD